LVYDGDCGSCSKFKEIVDVLDGNNRLEYDTLAEADYDSLLESIPKAKRNRSFHLISPKGNVLSGQEAILELMRLLPLGSLTSFLVSSFPIRNLTDFLYSVFVRLHDSSSCSTT